MGRFIKALVFAWVAMWAGSASAATVTVDIYAGEALLSSGVSGSVTFTDTSGPTTCLFGSICSATFNDTDTVTLTAVPTAGTLFGAWYAQDAAIVPQGPCHLSTSLTCTFSASDLITQNTSSIGAVFVTDPYPLVAPTSTTNRDYIVSPGITSTSFVLFADDSLATFSVAQQPEVGSVVFDPVYPGKFTYTNSTGLYQNISFDFAVTSGSGVSALSTTYTATFTINDFDTDGDGIFDSGDQCPATRSGAAVNASGCPLVNLTVNLVAQPSGEAIFDYGLIDMSPYGISCFEGVCQPFADYYEGQTATLSTYFVPERLLLSEWVNLTCDEGVNTGNTCTFAIPPADVDGNVVLQVDFIENPDYVNQAPSVSPLAIVAEAGVETVQTLFATDLENDPLTYSLGETTNALGNLSVDSGGAVTFTPADATSTGRWETTVTVSDGRQSRVVPLLVIVNPLGAALPTGAVGSFISYSADSNGAASSQFPSLTAADSGAVTYSVYIIDTEVSLTLTDVATGSFEFQANLGYTGDIGFIVEVTDSSGVSTAFPASVFVTQSKGPAGDSVCPSFAYPLETDVTGKSQCLLPNVVDQDLTLTSGITWVMYDPVIVGNGYKEIDLDGLVVDYGVTDTLQNVTLTIEAGTRVLALNEKAALFITRGSSINAVGTSTSPIMFESADLGQDGQGEWLGVFIQGRGIHRSCADPTLACNSPSVTGLGQVGGTISTDSSGALSYVVIAEAGSGFNSQEVSVGALTLESVGSGTQIDHVQVVGSAGRGMRVIGGDVDMAYLKIDFTLESSMSFEQGYQGEIQYLWAELSERVYEPVLISDLDPVFRSPPPERFTSPLISNATLLVSEYSSSAIRIDGHGGLYLFNSAMGIPPSRSSGFSFYSYAACLLIDADAADFVGPASLSTVFIDWEKNILQCARRSADFPTSPQGVEAKDSTGATTWTSTVKQRITQLSLAESGAVANSITFDPSTVFTSSTVGARGINTLFLEPVNFAGAVDPSLGASWWDGWAVSGLPGDEDADGVLDNDDDFPYDPAASVDTDGDGMPDDWNLGYTAADSTAGLVLDDDDDNDGLVDGLDAYPLDSTNPEGTCPSWSNQGEGTDCVLPSIILQDRYLTSSVRWSMYGTSKVGNGDLEIIDADTVFDGVANVPWVKPTITIEAGTTISASRRTKLIITRGAKINAEGTADQPIILAGDYDNSLVISGLALTGQCATATSFCNQSASSEGFYGGSSANDSSGVLRYITVEQSRPDFGGTAPPPALSLLGLGSGTVVDHIVVAGSSGKGVLVAGGNAHIAHLGVTDAFGDSLAWTDGFQGSMQFVVLDMGEQQQGDGIYAESGTGNGFATGLTDAQRSTPTISNLTIYNGSADDWVSLNLQDSGALVFDSVIMKGSVRPEEFESCVIGVEGDNLQGLGSWLVFDGILADCQGGAGTGYFTSVGNLSQSLDIVSAEAVLDVRLASLSPKALLDTPQDWVARLSGLTYAADPARFTSVSYLGAVDPTAGMDPWWLFGATSDAPDADGDGITDAEDAFPNDATEFVDSDGDGIGDVADTDDDNDGVVDTADAFPYSPRFSVDADGDGIAALIDLNDADNTVGLASWLDVEVAVTDSVLASCLAPLAASGLQPADIQTLECGGSIGSLTGLNLLKALQGVRIVTGAPLDVSALEQLPALKGVDLSGNAIKDSTILSGLTQVNTLYLGGNHLRNIDGLSALTNLVRLDLAGNYIQKADALSSLMQLQELRLANNDLVDASGLASLAAMRKLDVSRNQLQDLDFVSGLSNLQAIDASNNPIESVAGFATSQSPYLAKVDLANTLVPTLADYFDHFSTITCPSVVPTGLYCSTGVIEVANMSYLSCDELGALEGSSLTLGNNIFCQPDSDLDGYVDGLDDFITDPVAYRDTDNDGLPDEFFAGLTSIDSTSVPALIVDDDDDNDGVLDFEDAFPKIPTEFLDSDGDGIGDNTDYAPTDSTVAYTYTPDVLSSLPDFGLSQCVAQYVSGVSLGFSESTGVSVVTDGISAPSDLDYGTLARPLVYSDLITFLICDSVSSTSMNLSGIEALSYLDELSLESNGITDLTPLAGLKALSNLNLYDNNIVDVSALAELSQMRSLTLWRNQIEDVSPLANMLLLEFLDLDTNNVTSVSSLNQLSNLNEVYLYSNQIETLDGVEGWINLQFGWFSDNQITDISAIQGLAKLKELELANNLISDLPSFSGLVSLNYLDLNHNQIRNAGALSAAPLLGSLYLTDNYIRDIRFVTDIGSLLILDVSGNPITSLTDISASLLERLYLDDTGLRDVDSGRLPTSLFRLNLLDNQIQTIDTLLTNYLQDGGLSLSLYLAGNPLLCTQGDIFDTPGITIVSQPATCQEDFDSDGVADIFDLYPSDPAAATDSDGDGMPDVLFTASAGLTEDTDDDNDGVADLLDAFPLDPTESVDTDGDGVGDNKDADPNDPAVQYFKISSALAAVTDPALSSCAAQQADKAQTTDLITRLYCADEITDLSGLAQFPYLQQVQLVTPMGTGVTDLSQLSVLPDLRNLGLSGDFADLSALGSLSKLETLDLLFTSDGDRDISALGSLSNLKTLYLQNAQVSDWSALGALSQLESLSLPGAGITDLSVLPLASLTSLKSLNLSLNGFMALTGVENLSLLTDLKIDQTAVTDLSALSATVGLQSLSMAGIPATDLSVLSDLSSLESLHMPDVAISSSSIFASMGGLRVLNVDRTSVPDLIGLSTLTNMEFLSVSSNNLSSLSGIENMSFLEGLVAKGNALTTLDGIGVLSSLIFLNVSDNAITSIAGLIDNASESGAWYLEYFFADGNQISDVSTLGSLSDLRVVSLNDNDIASLNSLTGLYQLESLSARNNRIFTVPPVVNYDLQDLELGVHLDLTGNPLDCFSLANYNTSDIALTFDSSCVAASASGNKAPLSQGIDKAALTVATANVPTLGFAQISTQDALGGATRPAGVEPVQTFVAEPVRVAVTVLPDLVESSVRTISYFAALWVEVVTETLDNLFEDKETADNEGAQKALGTGQFKTEQNLLGDAVALESSVVQRSADLLREITIEPYDSLPVAAVQRATIPLNDFIEKSSGSGGGNPTKAEYRWDLFATSYGVLEADADIIWMNSEPAELHVLRAVR